MVRWLNCWQSKLLAGVEEAAFHRERQYDFNDTIWSSDCLYVNIPPLAPISSSVFILTQLLCESWPVLPVSDDLRGTGKERSDFSAAGMDIQHERRRLLDAEDGHDPTGLISEQDAYLRLVHTRG